MRPFWSMGALELVDMPGYMKRVADTMASGVAHARTSLLRIPADAPPQALAAKFLAIQ